MTTSPPTVLVTGAGSGIGLATAEHLAANGWRPALADRQPSVLDLGQRLGVPATVVDVTDAQQVEAWVEEHPDAAALVTAAGVCPHLPLLDSSDDDWWHVLDVNLLGTLRPLRAFARHRRTAGGGGAVVLVASNNAFWPARGFGAYCASKAGVLMLGRVAASELGALDIRVNVLAPGETETPMTAQDLADPREREAIISRTPLGRLGQPEDIARAVGLLLSEDATWITGQLLSADGGISLRGEPDGHE